MIGSEEATSGFVALDHGKWAKGVTGGLIRNTAGNILIRVSDLYQDDDLTTGRIATELIAGLKRHIAANPFCQIAQITLLLYDLPTEDWPAQDAGIEKLTLAYAIPTTL